MALTNLVTEMVESYHLPWGIKTRLLIQQIVYAISEVPGDARALANGKSDIISRLERDHLKVRGRATMLIYDLPLDDRHLVDNPSIRRYEPKIMESKSTQTEGSFSNKPVMALILD